MGGAALKIMKRINISDTTLIAVRVCELILIHKSELILRRIKSINKNTHGMNFIAFCVLKINTKHDLFLLLHSHGNAARLPMGEVQSECICRTCNNIPCIKMPTIECVRRLPTHFRNFKTLHHFSTTFSKTTHLQNECARPCQSAYDIYTMQYLASKCQPQNAPGGLRCFQRTSEHP